jgi:hypothetical protein
MTKLFLSLALLSTALMATPDAPKTCCKAGKVPCCSDLCCKASDKCCKSLDHKDCAKECKDAPAAKH